MASLNEILLELLQTNDCVVVPSFGGFIVKQKSARIDHEKGMAFPPYKELGFNIQLREQDGLLANRYGLLNHADYATSIRQIEFEVSRWNETIALGKPLKISSIGQFWKDPEGNIQFEQDRSFNLLMTAYGLEVIRFIPARLEPLEEITAIIKMPSKAKVWKYAAAAAIAIPLAFYSYWIPVKTPALESGMFSYQDFNPFKTQNNSAYQETQVELPGLEEVPVETTYTDAYKKHLSPTVTPHEPIISVIEPHVMYCIAGCFSSEENAHRLEQKLVKLGFNCSVIHEGSLYKVSLGQGFSEEAIDSILNKANSLNIQTWILK